MRGSLLGRQLLLLMLLSLTVPLSACGYLFGDKGYFRDTSEDYQTATELPVIAVADGRRTVALDEIYAIPPITAERDPKNTDEVLRPTPLLAAGADQMVRIQRLGDDSWALVAIPPGQLWPQVRSFLSTANIPIGRVDARAGIIETAYVDLQGQERTARFRFRVERGVQRGNSELHVLQMFQTSGTDAWPTASDDLELETDMLRGVAQFIANSADTAPVSMMAEQSISAAGRVAIVEEGGETFIRLELPFERAWASLSRSLELSGFEIVDRDRSSSVYYVKYVGEGEGDNGKGSGWFGWFGRGGDKGEDHPLAEVSLLVSMSEEPSGTMAIRMVPEAGIQSVSEDDLQSLLQRIRGNID